MKKEATTSRSTMCDMWMHQCNKHRTNEKQKWPDVRPAYTSSYIRWTRQLTNNRARNKRQQFSMAHTVWWIEFVGSTMDCILMLTKPLVYGVQCTCRCRARLGRMQFLGVNARGKKVTQKSFLFYHDLRSVRIDTVLHCCQWQWLRSLCVWLCLGSDRSAGRGEHRMPWHTGTHAPFSFNQHKFTIRRTMDPRCLRLLDSSQNFVFYHFCVSG